VSDSQTLKYWTAINQALVEEMERSPEVIILGEDVGLPGGPFGATKGLLDRFGPKRVRDTPISELGIAGVGVGAAMSGSRPVVEIMFNDFLTLAMDQIVNQAAKMSFMSGGKISVPLVIRSIVASGKTTGPQHGQSLEVLLAHIPGLKVVWPSNPADMKGLLKSAIRDDNPVVVLESLAEWAIAGEVPVGDHLVPIGRLKIVSPGTDLTIVSFGTAMRRVIAAGRRLAEDGIAAEVIDLRTISPLDEGGILESVRRTRRLLIVHDAVRQFGVGAEISALVTEALFSELEAAPRRLASPFLPVPFAPSLEQAYFPAESAIVRAATELVRGTVTTA
jgi:pyruvate/2-oxoglutarate/acetoin dehydrogenase E1 component